MGAVDFLTVALAFILARDGFARRKPKMAMNTSAAA
jgi:hypothetical protein